MGDSSQHDSRRRYARPGEFEIPTEPEDRTSILESNSFNQRFGGELNRNLKAPTSSPSELRPAVELNPVKQTLAPAPREARPIGGSPTSAKGLPPAAPQVRLLGGLNSTPKSLAPAPRQVRPVGGLRPPIQQRGAPLVGKATISAKRVSARFDLLPDPPSRWNRIGWSAAAQLATLAFLLLSPTIFPQEMQTALKFDVVELMQPVTHINIDVTPKPEPPPPPKVKPKVPPPQPKPIPPKPKPIEVEPPKLAPRQPHVFLLLKPQLPKDRRVEVKPVELKPMFAQAEIVLSTNQPKRPKEEMKAPILQPMRAKQDIKAPDVGLGGALPATILAAANKVQTGGFGDPHGIRGPANPGKAANINQAGSPNLPGGPGYGNGSGGAQGLRGTLASDGSKGGTGGTPAMGAVTSSVAILYEPNPAYTNEARVLKMEGDIVLEVVFLASGQVQIIRVVSGLGHGLDEAAIQAAKQIRFRPAKRNGQPVDFPAHVRIEFRLAK